MASSEYSSAADAGRAVQALLDQGQTVQAYDAAARALAIWKDDTNLLRSLGLALARLRVFDRANALLLRLFKRGSRDAETAGILARTFKDLWEANPTTGRRHLRSAFRYYAWGFRLARRQRDLDGAIYTGINAATTAWLLGRRDNARRRARALQSKCRARLKRGADYWALATLAETHLLLGDFGAAARLYSQASALAQRHVQRRASTRHNARLLLQSMKRPVTALDNCFGVPSVLIVTDEPDRRAPTPRRVLSNVSGKFGVAYVQVESAAGVMVAERLLQVQADVTVVLPLAVDALLHSRHALWSQPRWRARASVVLSRANRVVVAHPRGSIVSPTTIRYTETLQRGLAKLHADRLETTVTTVSAASLRQTEKVRRVAPTPGPAFRESIRALLFADVHGYSALREAEIPRFVTEFMGTVARCLRARQRRPDIRFSWGDALYFAFSSVDAAADCALTIQEALARKPWGRLGLPSDLGLRVAVHVGPALRCIDPIQRSRNYTGSQVSWAARIEPVTPPSEVYASEPFAALLAERRDSRVLCEYVGATALAKSFGTEPLYRLRRRPKP